MSVHVEALADEVFEAAAYANRATARVTRHPFGEIVTNPDYPDVFFVHVLANLTAPDWTVARLESVLHEELPAVAYDRVRTRDPETRDQLEPQLLAAGYEPEHKVAMLELSEPSVAAAGPLKLDLVTTRDQWAELSRMIAAEWGNWPERTVEQILRLYHGWTETVSDRHYLASAKGERVGRVGLLQHRTLGYVHGLQVIPSMRRRGVGTRAMLQLREIGRAMGCERLALLCAPDSWLTAFYRRLGFVVVGEEFTWMKAR